MDADQRRPETVSVAIWRTDEQSAASLPSYMTPGAAGCDLAAHLATPLEVEPGARCVVPTGLAIALPPGFEAQVRPRSGLAIREGLTVLNAPGTIDADYRGEILVALINLGEHRVTIRPGDRIAQLVLGRVARASWELLSSEEKDARGLATVRGEGGFGHTGSSGVPAQRRGDSE